MLAALKQKKRLGGPADMALFLPCNALQQGAEPDVPRSVSENRQTSRCRIAADEVYQSQRAVGGDDGLLGRRGGVAVACNDAEGIDMRRAARVLQRMNMTMW